MLSRRYIGNIYHSLRQLKPSTLTHSTGTSQAAEVKAMSCVYILCDSSSYQQSKRQVSSNLPTLSVVQNLSSIHFHCILYVIILCEVEVEVCSGSLALCRIDLTECISNTEQ